MGLVERLDFRPPPKQDSQRQAHQEKKSHKKWADIDRYLVDILIPSDPALDTALQSSEAAGLPLHSVSPNQGKFLMLLARTVGARSILEIGTLGGYSTIWLARSLAPGGKVTTLEANPQHAKVALANIACAGVGDRVDLRLGAALDTLPTLEDEAPYDFIFIDADRLNIPNYFKWALKLARPGSLIVVDNVIRHGAVVNKGDSTSQSLRQFFALAAAERRVTATAMQTVGVKGHDGFAIAHVEA
ncbi:MAG: O-methyltransferase [Methyloceanibacter sp.]|jgi:predicted O-methyltransferase YrrM